MINSKLFEILSKFNKKEFKKFGLLVLSPFFNTNPTLIKFYNIFKRYHPEFNSNKLEKVKIFNSLYPDKPYNDGAMRNIVSDMMSLSEKFIIQLMLNENTMQNDLSLIGYFNQVKLDEMFKRKINKVESMLPDFLLNEEVYFNNLKILEKEKQLYRSTRNKEYVDFESGINENLYAIYSYLFTLFRSASNALNHKLSFNDSSFLDHFNEVASIINIDELVTYFKMKNYKYIDVIELYYLNYVTLKNLDNDELFYNLRQRFESIYKTLSDYALYNLIVSIENCCTFKIHNGKYEFIEEYIKFQKWLESNGVISTPANYYFNSLRFINTITYASYLKDFGWQENYINKYINRISPEYQKSVYNLSFAYINFDRGNYDTALDLLGKVSYDHALIKLYIREMLLMIYFETGKLESSYSMIDSFRHFLSQNKSISPAHKQRYSNFLRFYEDLIRISQSPAETQADLLKLEIIKHKAMLRPKCTMWMLEKINEMELINNNKKKIINSLYQVNQQGI